MRIDDERPFGGSSAAVRADKVAKRAVAKIDLIKKAGEARVNAVLDKHVEKSPPGWLALHTFGLVFACPSLTTRDEVREAFESRHFGMVADMEYIFAKHHYDELLQSLNSILELAELAVKDGGAEATMVLSANDNYLL